ncbi:class I SAM-dependent methyltransferase [Luteipulveratus sp. YIM 133132]|uniref:class I SAM-dependent methyltransferase n=1 Tax=Luteipulveratus flavus TaxID=3031728 RepID=UPI0023B09ADB|nr:class I SAM-dependent methyltransferase [Luteipulveratus sp. YIM 133132]MDE9364730.1 class I SAM-dependent methyltransferase [Luteipulveratus sp. YIM 133132]
MDAKTQELREAHDVISAVYAERLAHIIDTMPVERGVLGVFRDLVLESGLGTDVGDIGCGTGRLAPYLAGLGLTPSGVDLSPEMIRLARRDYPGHPFDVADVRSLPFADASLAGALGWYSLMYLAPDQRPRAFAELARVVRPGGHVAIAYKQGDDTPRRGGRSLDVAFDIYWLSEAEMARRVTDAGFRVVLTATKPADPDELQPQGYLIARRC